MRTVDGTLSALADPTRRGIVELLSKRPRRAGELAEAFQMSPPAISRHLRILRTRKLIAEDRAPHDARQRVFRLRREPFAALSVWVSEIEAFWTEQLDSFKEIVARKQKGKKA
jgi:DNA-binding transcriptional ArsR family regulator